MCKTRIDSFSFGTFRNRISLNYNLIVYGGRCKMDQDALRSRYFIILTTLLIDLALCTHHSKYIEYDIENQKDCDLIGLNKQNRDLAVIVKITLDHAINTDTSCTFVIKANKGDGLFGVIQKMTFRRNGTQCLDYVQFRRSDLQETQKFCAHFDRSKTKYYPVPEPANSSYEFDIGKNGGRLETTIFIAKKRYLFQDEIPTVSIVYTPYKKCDNIVPKGYKAIRYKSCILEDYFCDGYQNCAPDICLDEANCPNVTDIISNDLLFWSPDCAGPSAHSSLPRLGGQESGSTSNQVPTAPMLEVAVPPLVLDKDLPPSYDSLFPEQNNSTAQ
ncbi:hypothetical protein KPH14_011198 [Odynerus spinipes]|uniref:Uncharacterized protein n=1 Tax=Odynerus spinipes TaxID=1348599 RepID=A0AAD9R942_9HYME|nr:hypothetical protein KPH14_011198 [Odynerus spinipes]